MTSTASKHDPEDRYLSRTEFESFERNVEKNFRGVSESIGLLSTKLDRLSTRGTDWRAIFAGMSALTAILAAVGGVVAWGIVSKLNAQETGLAALRVEHDRDAQSLGVALDRRLEMRATLIEPVLQAIDGRLDALSVSAELSRQRIDDLREELARAQN